MPRCRRADRPARQSPRPRAPLRAGDDRPLHRRRAAEVPIEATAAFAMRLLRGHGILTVHFAGMPPGTSAILFKFVPPETLARFGGAAALARAVDDALGGLAALVASPEAVRALLFG